MIFFFCNETFRSILISFRHFCYYQTEIFLHYALADKGKWRITSYIPLEMRSYRFTKVAVNWSQFALNKYSCLCCGSHTGECNRGKFTPARMYPPKLLGAKFQTDRLVAFYIWGIRAKRVVLQVPDNICSNCDVNYRHVANLTICRSRLIRPAVHTANRFPLRYLSYPQ